MMVRIRGVFLPSLVRNVLAKKNWRVSSDQARERQSVAVGRL